MVITLFLYVLQLLIKSLTLSSLQNFNEILKYTLPNNINNTGFSSISYFNFNNEYFLSFLKINFNDQYRYINSALLFYFSFFSYK